MNFLALFFQRLWAVSGLLASATAGRRCCIDRNFPKPQDSNAQSLRQNQGQMILAVNTGSFCGFAGQHGGLTFVHDNYTIHRYVTRVESYSNRTAPDSRTLVAHIERWLT